jgi:RNA polymerase sigma-70 factor (ECF subfamily)
MNMESNHTHPFRVDLHTFNQLFREQYPALRAYAGFLVGDGSAEDIVQDLFLYTWENRQTITIHTSIKAWLFKSVHNRCLNNLKRTQMLHHNHRQIESGLNEQEMLLADPEKNHIIQKLYMNDLRIEINQAIDSLPNKCREVFILSYLEAFKNKQISQELNISVSTVEKHINHALKTLRKTLEHIKILFLNFLLL